MRFLAAAAVCFAVMFLAASVASAAIVTKEVAYKDGDAELQGFLVYDDAQTTPAPAVAVVHEWWGHNAYARSRAEQLAKLGYVAFVLDMYGKGKEGKTPDEAKALSAPFYADRALMRSRAQAGLAVLKALPQVDAEKLAVIGYCFGGTVALELARGGADLAGVVSFHGGLATPSPAKEGVIKASVLALNGADDSFVPVEERQAFVKEMKDAKAVARSIDYAGATHAFTNPVSTANGKKFNLPIAYNETADQQSWKEMQSFLEAVFAPVTPDHK